MSLGKVKEQMELPYLKNDPIGIVTLANLVEDSWSQNAVEDEESVVEENTAQTDNVVNVGAISHRAQHSQIYLQEENTCDTRHMKSKRRNLHDFSALKRTYASICAFHVPALSFHSRSPMKYLMESTYITFSIIASRNASE